MNEREAGVRKSRIQSAREALSSAGLDAGKLPPQAKEVERIVLGAMMLEKSAVDTVIDILSPSSFYEPSNQKIYAAIQWLFQDGKAIDMVTVTQRLRSTGELDEIGGPYYVSSLTNRVASTANVEEYARVVSQKFIQRELIRLSNEILKDAYEDTTDVFDLLDRAEKNLFEVTKGNIRKEYSDMKSVMRSAVDQIEKARANQDGVSGVPSGFTDLDRVTGGWQRSDMIVLAARPGMGKTALVLSMARNMAVNFHIPVALFSLEMSSVQLVQRLIASETEISSEKLRKGTLEDHEYAQLHNRIGPLNDAPLFIDDTPALSVFELRAKCRRLKSEHGIQMVVIDYLQLMTAGGDVKGGNREQEISTISRSIKGIAKELDVPVIALSQLSRSVESRGGDKKPMLSDLRESGAIEQDADIVCFIYRREYYGMDQYDDGTPSAGRGDIIIAKHRNGALETINLRFIGRLAKFTNMDDGDFSEQSSASTLQPNTDFDMPNTIIRASKMNDEEEGDFLKGDSEEVPF